MYSTAPADWAEPLLVRVDLAVMTIKGYLTPDGLASYPGHTFAEVLPLYKDAVGVFYSASRLDCIICSVIDTNGQILFIIILMSIIRFGLILFFKNNKKKLRLIKPEGVFMAS